METSPRSRPNMPVLVRLNQGRSFVGAVRMTHLAWVAQMPSPTFLIELPTVLRQASERPLLHQFIWEPTLRVPLLVARFIAGDTVFRVN